MSYEENRKIFATVEDVLAGKELLEQPRAVLLFRLCQFSMLMNTEKAEQYWALLQPIQNKLPTELQGELTQLRSLLEESLASGAKGFTAEMITEIKAARELADYEMTKKKLLECETQLKKRFLPFGKGPVWNMLVETWISVDRTYALQLLKNVSGNLQDNYITKMNKSVRLSPEEWDILVSSVGMGKVEQIALKILDDEVQDLSLPKAALLQVATQIRNSITQLSLTGNQAEVVKKFTRYRRLLTIHTNSDQAELLPELLEELYLLIAKTPSLDQIWPTRFVLITGIIGIGVQLGAQNLQVLTPEFIERLIAKTPTYLNYYLWASWAGLTASPGQVEQVYTDLMSRVKQDQNAEAWFLVTLVERGLGDEAINLAAKLVRSQALLPRLRRAWLCSHPETAMTAIRPEDMAGDPIGEFLAQGNAEKRAAYLKSVTLNGARSVPGAMWAGVGTESEPEGLRGFWKQLTAHKKTTDEILIEYLKRNPLYSSYQKNTKKEDQFSETLRMNGFGEYRYQDVDSAQLAAFVIWGNQEPLPIRSVLRVMWNAIRPDDTILMVDWLRNAIMSRCVNVFAADTEVLIEDYLGWVKNELVQKGRQWQFGNQVVTLRFPATALLSFCVTAAAGVSGLSPTRRDQILITGLDRFETSPELVEVAAQLYNSDKAPLTLTPPLKLKPNLQPAWQLGVVKNALSAILKAVIEEGGSNPQ